MRSLKDIIRKGASTRLPRIMIVGVEGVGKSTFGAQCPSPLFLCSEDGLVGKGFDAVSSISTESWTETLGILDEMAKDSMGHKTLVIDTLDWLEPQVEQHVIRAANDPKITSIESFGFGKGSVMVAEEFRRFFSRLEAVNHAGVVVVLLAHSIIKTFSNPVGDNYDRYEAKSGKKVAAMAREWCDAVLFATFLTQTKSDGMAKKATGGTERIVYTSHTAGWDAKNRHGMPEVLPLDTALILQWMGVSVESAEEIKDEIAKLLTAMPEEKAKKAAAAVAGAKDDVTKLKAIKARCETTIKETENA